MVRAIVFDVDGTLIDTEDAVLNSLQQALLEVQGQSRSTGEIRFVLGIPGARALPRLGIAPEDMDRVNERWNFFLKDHLDSITIFPGIMDVLKRLKEKGVSTGIVTSKTRRELEDDFVPFGLMEYLTHVVCADDTVHHKPHSDPILKWLERSGADPSETIYIGDTTYDMECAQGAGVEFGLAVWGCRNHGEIHCLRRPERPQEILALLEEK